METDTIDSLRQQLEEVNKQLATCETNYNTIMGENFQLKLTIEKMAEALNYVYKTDMAAIDGLRKLDPSFEPEMKVIDGVKEALTLARSLGLGKEK